MRWREFLESDEPPTAIVAADANEGLGVWYELNQRGFSVPGDVSLIALHKLPAEDYRTPAMTCVEMPLLELGRRAVELLLDNPWDVPIQETLQQAIHVSPGPPWRRRHPAAVDPEDGLHQGATEPVDR